ncbi:MAG: NAD(+)/NADH kinase [Firmicutes bacterium]|nr:NAD(+)/NADH kinase [Bacillota bacterium]
MPKRIGIIANRNKASANEIATRLVHSITARGAIVVLDEDTAEAIGRADVGKPICDFPEAVDLIFVLGGDGTLLGVARQLAAYDIPLLGINIGHLGFLSEAEPSDLEMAVTRVLEGDFFLERRMMIRTEVWRREECVHSSIGLNDAGIGKGSFARMIEVSVSVDGELWDAFAGDGLIVSTPTGSTAYSLSCGGPIVVPHMQVMILTPICAHKLVSRPCVIGCEQTVTVEVSATHHDFGLTVDGQVGFGLQTGDRVIVRRAACDTTLIRWRERAFFSILQGKLSGES